MWFYDMVAYIDSDVLLMQRVVDVNESIFSAMDTAINNHNSYVFGASQDLMLLKGVFNAAIMVIQPSCFHFKRIIELASHQEL